MRQKFFLTVLFILMTGAAVLAQSTDVGITPKFAGGEVTAVESGKIVLQTKDGAIDVLISDKTVFKKVLPDNPKISAAVDAGFSDISAGDKLLVTGEVAADKKSVPAKTVYLMTKASISEKQTREAERWQTRGISGRVTNLNFEKNEITISVRNPGGETSVVIKPKERAKILRYAPNSNKYSEAKPSRITEIFIDDTVRALGDRSPDGASFEAEEIISGSFQTVGGTVKTVNAEAGQIVIEDIKTKREVTITIGEGSVLKKFPAEMAQRMAQMQAGGGIRPPQAGQANPPSGENRPPAGPPAGPRPGMRGDINEMFERLPVITLADLKAGDMIAVSSTKTDDPTKITAIRLLAGVEPFLNAPQPQMNGRGRGRGGQDTGFTIPGLDGADFP